MPDEKTVFPTMEDAPVALPLESEHRDLGARFGDFGPYEVPLDYGEAETLDDELDHPLLADASYQGLLRVSGKDAYLFLHTMCTADLSTLDSIGSFTPSLVLTGEGEVIDLIDIFVTGDDEYLIIANAPHAEELFAWLDAHSMLEDKEGKVFPDLELSDESGLLAQFVLLGPGAVVPLEDMAETPFERAPHDNAISLLKLDEVPAMVAHVEIENTDVYRIFVPSDRAALVWRSLLSFPEIQVIGLRNYQRILERASLLLPDMESPAYQTPSEAGMVRLLRNERDFVGAHALEPIQ